jgi:hypothetical protein
MDYMEPINGVSLEKYAELCALMADTGTDTAKQAQIAEANGVSAADFEAAKTGWTARMSDPSNMGQVAMAFMPLMAKAQEKNRGGGAPGPLEVYTRVHAEMAFKKDENGNQMDYMKVLEANGFTQPKWLEMENYWTPRVINDPTKPQLAAQFNAEDSAKFQALMQQESDKINGIVR